MQIERVEELCLNYLSQCTNPLVPINALLEHCRRDPLCAELQQAQLIDFLKHHELVHVVEPADTNVLGPELFSGVGLNDGPQAILKSRFPSREEVGVTLQEHLKRMTSALATALEEAEREQCDPAALEQLREAMAKAQALKEKMEKFT